MRAAPVYFSARTASTVTAAQIQAYCNAQWETVIANSVDIIDFNVSAVSGSVVLVGGVFDMGTTWEQRSYYIRLVDPNGSVAAGNANVQFRRKLDTATP